MLNEKQNEKMLQKLEQLLVTADAYFFDVVDFLDYKMFQTKEHLRAVPPAEVFIARAAQWGGEGQTCWFRGRYQPKPELAGLPLFVRPNLGGYEAMLWINGKPAGTFAAKIVVTRHGNHYCDLIAQSADPEEPLDIAIEFYAGHKVIGCQPFENTQNGSYYYQAGEIEICTKNQLVIDFALDLRSLIQLARKLDLTSYRRADIMNTLTEVHKVVLYSPENCKRTTWLRSLELAREKMISSLNRKNGDSTATAMLIGHSHMDTAWLWTIDETIRKNARTISNQMSLMKQYPEYKFIQSSAYHMQMIEQEYPAIFEEMKTKIAEGRYEPNGGVWIECDCNITSGEALIRQFLWGQRYTRQKFNYTADCFWLPDTFGYSAAIPQIMHGCEVKYFLTTKMAWNDTNQFPYETFTWRGIDGSEVITHLFEMDTWPDPASLLERLDGIGYKNHVRAKQAFDGRLIAFGYGDGGGGPQFEMIEVAKRLEDLEGCPRVKYTTVSEFMRGIDKRQAKLPLFDGELYLELHRGTLTSKQQIKRNNRLSEIVLHNLEFLEVFQAVMNDQEATDASYRDLWQTLLINQFHDILPGTCIAAAHDQSLRQTGLLLDQAQKLINERSQMNSILADVLVINPAGVEKNDAFYIDGHLELIDKTNEQLLRYQQLIDLDGKALTAVSGVKLPAYGIATLKRANDRACTSQKMSTEASELDEASNGKINETTNDNSTFAIDEGLTYLHTPFYKVRFDSNGFISSLVDIRVQRELCDGLPLNTFVAAEDVPAAWDGWDTDADCIMKLQPDARLMNRHIAASGPVEFRIRSSYQICMNSRIEQDMIFYADSPLITFDTRLNWHDKHRLLKTTFATSIKARHARCETQFGNITRPTTRNNSFEQAMFEVCNHKYTDLSEPGYGISLLNDCKYGIGIEGATLTLTLAKGGLRPDERGDEGAYQFRYGLLPHIGGFSAENVVLPAYSFNYHPIVAAADETKLASADSFAKTDSANIIIETIKPCEDSAKAYILRLYECEGTAARSGIRFMLEPKSVTICNMLEETIKPADEILVFKPFEIKTLRVEY